VAAASRSPSELGAFDPNLDHFARLGLPRRPNLARDTIEDAYLRISAEVHPDRFAAAEPEVVTRARAHAAAVNEAHGVLRERVRRLEYLVKLGGIDIDSSDPTHGAPHPSQEFLIEMIEWRDRVEQMQPRELEHEVGELERASAKMLDEASACIEAGEVSPAAAWLVRRRYFARLVEEIEAALDAA
jgi:molecular chaperone HscB